MLNISDHIFKIAFVFCFILLRALYICISRYKYWKTLGIPHTGFLKDISHIFKNRSYITQIQYKDLNPHPFGGVYYFSKPFLMIRDPQLIRNVLIKDFSHFTDRGTNMDENVDPLSAHIFHLRGQRWKSIRSKLTPTYSSGKLKAMFPLLEECTKVLGRYLEREIENSPEMEVRETMRKYSADVIGIFGFGLDCNMIDGKNSGLAEMNKAFQMNQMKTFVRQALRLLSPKILSLLNWKSLPQEAEDYFFALVSESKKYRAQNVEKRNDFMQLIINVQHEELEKLRDQNDGTDVLFTDKVVAAHTFVFFAAGHETTATTLAYALYELALNPDIMERLHEEIETVFTRSGNKLNYEVLKELNYLECVISETLRKYPLVGWLDRQCVRSYQMPNSSLIIKEDESLIIPVYALHRDPLYYPNPEKFDPGRFNEENKHKIVSGTYLPFGDGPRICIGMRLALMEMKAALSLIIGNFTVHPTEKTQIPIKFKTSVLNVPEKGVHLRFQKREKPLISYVQNTPVKK